MQVVHGLTSAACCLLLTDFVAAHNSPEKEQQLLPALSLCCSDTADTFRRVYNAKIICSVLMWVL